MNTTRPETPNKLAQNGLVSGPARVRLLNSPGLDRFRHLAARRRLVAGYVATTLAEGALLALSDREPLLTVPFVLLGLTVGVFLIGALNGATRGVIDLRERDIDERQQQVRARAYRRTHRIVLAGFVCAAAGFLAAGLADFSPSGSQRLGALLATGSLLMMLPTLVAAWTEPDEPSD